MVNFSAGAANMAVGAGNSTIGGALPPLPEYKLTPMPALLPFISDFWLSLVLPHLFYWLVSLVFHLIDTFELFSQYRLHTPEEITARNHASRGEVARDVVIEQLIQVATSALLSITEPVPMAGKEDYDVAVWAQRIRLAQRALPALLGVLGFNAAALAKSMSASHPILAGALAGGHYAPFISTATNNDPAAAAGLVVPAFVAWETALAKAIYWLLIPGFQIWFAVVVLDSWQYFWHRLMHVNRWMYTHWHSRHHRLYVPYAYGALYNHPVEGFVLDTMGAGLAYKVSLMSPRCGMLFFVGSTIKTVDDHCGYALPWDPLQHITSNNAAYHDIHHQSWGIKTNFSQPFFTIWDRWLGTMWQGDTKVKYARDRNNAERKVGAAAAAAAAASTAPVATTTAAAPTATTESESDQAPVGKRAGRKAVASKASKSASAKLRRASSKLVKAQ